MSKLKCKLKIDGDSFNAEVILTSEGVLIKKVRFIGFLSTPVMLIPYKSIISVEFRKTFFYREIRLKIHVGIRIMNLSLKGGEKMSWLYNVLKTYKMYSYNH